jgi:hypothetical protein
LIGRFAERKEGLLDANAGCELCEKRDLLTEVIRYVDIGHVESGLSLRHARKPEGDQSQKKKENGFPNSFHVYILKKTNEEVCPAKILPR